MGEALTKLLSELESCRGDVAAGSRLCTQTGETLVLPVDGATCCELKALADVFGCEPGHLAQAILKSALADIHSGLDDDLDHLARQVCESGTGQSWMGV